MAKRIAFGVLWLSIAALVLSVRLDLPRDEVDAHYRSSASRFVPVAGGARIHVRVEGNEGAPPLVLVHGSNDSLLTWEPWVRELSDTFRVVSLDLPAHGLTGRVPGDDYSNAAYVRVLRGVVDALELPSFALAGNSMGGNVSWQFALQHPDRVRALILLDASGYPDGRLQPAFARVLALPGASVLFRWLNPRPLIESGLHDAVHDPAVITEADLDRTEAFVRRQGSRDALAMRRQLGFEPTPYARMRELHMPTLILWGKHDRFVPLAHAQRFHADIPGSKLIVYEGVGHLPMREIPQRSAADVRAFLSGVPDA